MCIVEYVIQIESKEIIYPHFIFQGYHFICLIIKMQLKAEEIIMNKSTKVAVIGAGVSGLYITQLLLAKGYEVTVFEASDRIGGRVKAGMLEGQVIDLGGHWIHKTGESSNALISAIIRSGEPFSRDDDDTYITKMANGHDTVPGRPFIVDRFIQYVRQTDFEVDQPLMKTLTEFSDSPVLRSFLNASVADQGSSCATFSTVKFKELISSGGAEHHELENRTMSEFIQAYFSGIPRESILLSTPVLTVKYACHKVNLVTGNGSFQFDKVMISVPISQLRSNKITFDPPLPERKINAFQKIGMGYGIKMFLFFRKSVLSEATFNRKFAPYYLQKKMGSHYVVLSLLMGEFMEDYTQDKEGHLEGIFSELAEISGKEVRSLLENSVFHDWTAEPFIEGTYSYPVAGIGNAREIASEPVLDTLFFIGEAMNTESAHASISGAMDTAYQVSLQF